MTDFAANLRQALLAQRVPGGWWEGQLSSSALSTATAIIALHITQPEENADWIRSGTRWLQQNQNADGGWGDTPISLSNLSTTLLVWSALSLVSKTDLTRAEAWIRATVGCLEPDVLARAVISRYGRDKTFSVPILMTAAICGRLGKDGWRRVLPLPLELAALPRRLFGIIGLPVVSYALPAMIAIGYARYFHRPPAWWNPLRWLRSLAWPRVRVLLKTLQPSTGGYLEATPLTSFVTMALASAGQGNHPCIAEALHFLRSSMRSDGSWPIDTNLSTWGTTLAVKALDGDFDSAEAVKAWLLAQQYQTIHPFTHAAPGGWAWTDLPGGVPDADDTSGALIALHLLCKTPTQRAEIGPQAEKAVIWLLDLQNRDGGIPTFCRGWGTLPFDRSTPEITAHSLWAWAVWEDALSTSTKRRLQKARPAALNYLLRSRHCQRCRWEPLWFGNEHAPEQLNLIFGTACVVHALRQAKLLPEIVQGAADELIEAQNADGSWGARGSVEETARVITALKGLPGTEEAISRSMAWLVSTTDNGSQFPAGPIGLYFARLWYHERLYPLVWATEAV